MSPDLAPLAEPHEDLFARRLAAWRAAHGRFGPARSYPFAWRLPDLARPAGRAAVIQARYALALTLHDLGRFDAALAGLPEPGADAAITLLHARCLCLQGQGAAGLALARTLPPSGASLAGLAYLHYLVDDAARALDACVAYRQAAATPLDGHWATLLACWARARLGLAVDEGAAQRAWSGLAGLAPALAAHGAALHAEARYRQGPRWALVWLDDALEQGERFGQHHLKARLLGLKAHALAAAGQLGEARRFQGLARDLAQRQGAALYLDGD